MVPDPALDAHVHPTQSATPREVNDRTTLSLDVEEGQEVPFASSNKHSMHPVAHLVSLEQVANGMESSLSLRYVPRKEFIDLSSDLKSAKNDLAGVISQVRTMSAVTTSSLLNESHV